MSKAEEIMDFLKQNSIQILSTCVNDRPISRPIGSATLINDRIYYCMNTNKAMFKQLQNNPKVCICVCANDLSWIRIFSKIVFDEDKNIKQEFINLGKTRFKSSDDENFGVFYLDELEAEIHQGLMIKKI